MDDDENGLFNIDISPPSSPASSSEKLPRDHQSEEDWKHQKAEWRPKVEVGEIWKTLTLPIDKPSKPVSQTILHAIEELYFFARYEEALKFTEEALKGNLEEGFKKTVVEYKGRCQAKIKTSQR